ncbi:hypothetical protein Pyn_36353 [Prunus yedoensis var. nudiflora]|uniref:Uncharacterized protein n=1 Tax=Prunus yedoensis var. nudiflora TaxID=2094558 RepID=A0A314YHW7_PRUYE|nr:hypothetical protein Pyn_36353 [Prunus yedoensis var. nudiflora]
MLSLINKDHVPLSEIIFHAICSKSRSHGKAQKGSLIFPSLITSLCALNYVPVLDTDIWNDAPVPYSRSSISLSDKLSSHSLVQIQGDSSSSSSIIQKNILHNERKIQYLKGLLHNDLPMASPLCFEDSTGSIELS